LDEKTNPKDNKTKKQEQPKKQPPQVNKRPTYVPAEVNKKDRKKYGELLRKKKQKNWYEQEYVQLAAIVTTCAVVLLVVYSYTFSQ